jgi:sulfur transfer protein SufE
MTDLEQIARQLLDDLPDAFITRGASDSVAMPGVVAVLRQVWNARGAADIKAIEDSDIDVWGEMDAINAIKALDR